MLKKIFPLVLVLVGLSVLSAAAQDKGLTFVGKIEEIATKTTLTPVGAMEKILTLKLDSKPKLDIRMTTTDAARFGLLGTDQPSGVITPGKIKGVGWKVKLTCDKKTTFGGEPTYLVTNLERLD
jgi:hypothetical protein